MIDKKSLFEACKNMLLQRIADGEKAMLDAQEAANSEEKSSMGDKYETGRAMSQLARDMSAKQVFENKQELANLLKLENTKTDKTIVQGSVVMANEKVFYIAVGLGVIDFNGMQVTVLSPKAPLAQLMLGKKAGDVFELNKKQFAIEQIN
ncbi:MAG: 3-oxoacyl-ACP synthase [Bacteroidia bacterium]|nr:3-oxoacyl-ACP synthase [Bacteroidia bacterium]